MAVLICLTKLCKCLYLFIMLITTTTLHCSAACGIEVGDHFIVTGGKNWNAPEFALATVAKYSQSGLVEYLPFLNKRRYWHACSSFISDGGETVGIIL